MDQKASIGEFSVAVFIKNDSKVLAWETVWKIPPLSQAGKNRVEKRTAGVSKHFLNGPVTNISGLLGDMVCHNFSTQSLVKKAAISNL